MDEKEIFDEDFVEGFIKLIESKHNDNKKLAVGIFDSMLDSEEDMNKFMDSFDKTLNKKTNQQPSKEEYNKNYIKLCLEHTRWINDKQ
jgi:hypothetical protein